MIKINKITRKILYISILQKYEKNLIIIFQLGLYCFLNKLIIHILYYHYY